MGDEGAQMAGVPAEARVLDSDQKKIVLGFWMGMERLGLFLSKKVEFGGKPPGKGIGFCDLDRPAF